MPKINYMGLDIRIEYKKGDTKPFKNDPYPGISESGWPMYADYGYIEDTVSNEEGEELDVYVGPDRDSECAYFFALMRDENKNSGDYSEEAMVFDEFKVLLGFKDKEAAKEFAHMQYPYWKCGAMYETTIEDLKELMSLQAIKAAKEKLMISDGAYEAGQTPDTAMAGEVFNAYGQPEAAKPKLVIRM